MNIVEITRAMKNELQNLIIRKPKEQDFDTVKILYTATYSLYHKNIPNDFKNPPKKSIPKGTFLSMIEDKEALFLVAEYEKEVIGLVYATIEEDGGNDWTVKYKRVGIDEISVLPSHSRKGVGTKLIKKVEDWAKKKKIKQTALIVHDFNKSAISFYAKNNYAPYSIQMKKKIE